MTLNKNENPTVTNALNTRLRRFRREDDGGMIIFSLILFVLILTFGGMAVDLMRFETTRAQLQATLDRCTLAAADLDQTMGPAEVCRDYVEKAGMTRFLDSVEVDEGLNYRKVTATASARMPLFFYDLPRVFMSPFTPGQTSLNVSAGSSAEERVSDVEISLVLDVSGSMNNHNRIQNLQPAAREFVTTVLANNTNAPEGLITVSIIPYSAVVNPGTDIAPLLNINRTHVYSTCPLFDADIFNTTALDVSTQYDHVSHFSNSGSYNVPFNRAYEWCYSEDRNSIVPHTVDEDVLHTAINKLEPYGNTAIDMGMKWAVGLLDPSTRSIISSLAGENGTGVPTIASGRPHDFPAPDDPDGTRVLKVVVLMTDGENTDQWDLIEPYKSYMSPVWFNRQNPNEEIRDIPYYRWSVQVRGEETPYDRRDDWFYYEQRDGNDRAEQYPRGFFSLSEYVNASPENSPSAPGEGKKYDRNIYHATWQELYADRAYYAVNDRYLAAPRPYIPNSTNSLLVTNFSGPDYPFDKNVVNDNQADDRLTDICQAARDQGIIIYTVAFEAPGRGRTALRDCASSPSHYFDVEGTDISAAFSAIASDIRALKLTQ